MSAVVTIDPVTKMTDELQALLLEADPDWSSVQHYLTDATLYGITQAGTWIAEICVLAVGDQQLEIKNLSVHIAYQRQGLAKALIQHVIDQATEQGVQGIWVKTGNSSLDQLALYQKSGFRMHHIEKDVFLDYPEMIFENGIRCLDQVVLYLQTAVKQQ